MEQSRSEPPVGENSSSLKPPPSSRGALSFPGAISIHWFIQLRWVAGLGQLLVVLTVHYWFRVPLEVQPLLSTVAVTGVSNLFLTIWYLKYRSSGAHPDYSRLLTSVLAGVMAFDLLLLTGLLYYSGGPSNPFWIFYLVNLCLAGIELTAGVVWCLNFLAVCCFAFLLYDHHTLQVGTLQSFLPSIQETGAITLEHNGVFCAFITCASVIVFFSTLVTSKLRAQEEENRLLEAKRSRGEKLEALGTLAAGTAHELSTPLGTIAIIAGELQHELNKFQQEDAHFVQLQEDVALIRTELDRCRSILNHLSAQAGQGTIEKKEKLSGKKLLDLIMEEIKEPSRIKITISPQAEKCQLYVGPYITAQALRGTIKNALDASPVENEVLVDVRCEKKFFVLSVIDTGDGIPEDILARIGEPFFTTKETGKGMGLGVFLARTVVERLGGTMHVASQKDQGTTVTCSIPTR